MDLGNGTVSDLEYFEVFHFCKNMFCKNPLAAERHLHIKS